MPSKAAAQAAADYSVTDTDGNPSYKGDLTLLALFLDKAKRAVPQAHNGAQHVSLIEKGYILDHIEARAWTGTGCTMRVGGGK